MRFRSPVGAPASHQNLASRVGLCIASLCLGSWAAAAGAQEAAPGLAAPYFYLLEASVDKDSSRTWSRAMQATAFAHNQHHDGNLFATYSEVTGGPEANFAVLFPVGKLAELDNWKPLRQIVVGQLGREAGSAAVDALELATTRDRLISLSEELSLAPEDLQTTPPHLWVVRVLIEAGSRTEYAALTRRVRRAHQEHESGYRWLAYANAIGGDDLEIFYFYPLQSLGELDEWPRRDEIVARVYGSKEGQRLAAAVASITSTTTSLWRLEPTLSSVDLAP